MIRKDYEYKGYLGRFVLWKMTLKRLRPGFWINLKAPLPHAQLYLLGWCFQWDRENAQTHARTMKALERMPNRGRGVKWQMSKTDINDDHEI